MTQKQFDTFLKAIDICKEYHPGLNFYIDKSSDLSKITIVWAHLQLVKSKPNIWEVDGTTIIYDSILFNFIKDVKEQYEIMRS